MVPDDSEVLDDGELALDLATERITLQLCRNSKGQLGMSVRDDNFVAVVDDGGGAQAAGICAGDWIVAIGREPNAVEVDNYKALLPFLKATRVDVATSVVVRYSAAQHPSRVSPARPPAPTAVASAPLLAAKLLTGGSRADIPAGLPPASAKMQPTKAASASAIEASPRHESPRRRHSSSRHASSRGASGASPSGESPSSGGSLGAADGGTSRRRRRRTHQREGAHHRAQGGASSDTASRPPRPQMQLHQTFDNLPVGTSAHEPGPQVGHGSGRRRRSHQTHNVHRQRREDDLNNSAETHNVYRMHMDGEPNHSSDV